MLGQAHTPRRRLLGVAAAVALALAIPAAGGADPSKTADTLRRENANLESRSRSAVLGLYSLDAQLARAQARLTSLQTEAQTLRAQQVSLRRQLAIARRDSTLSERRLAHRIRVLYEQHDVSTIEVILGAKSLDEAVTGLENLNRVTRLDQQVLAQVESARAHLGKASGTLDARAATLAGALRDAEATAASLAQAKSQRSAYIAGLRQRRDLNTTQISQLTLQARAAAARTQELTRAVADAPAGAAAVASFSPTAAAATDATPVAPVATATPSSAAAPTAGGRTISVSATGYALAGTTATGIPVGWGVAAVDPRVIPLGTHMTIPGYGEAVAADTGGAVIGATIDLWFPTVAQAQAWGRRSVTITLH